MTDSAGSLLRAVIGRRCALVFEKTYTIICNYYTFTPEFINAETSKFKIKIATKTINYIKFDKETNTFRINYTSEVNTIGEINEINSKFIVLTIEPKNKDMAPYQNVIPYKALRGVKILSNNLEVEQDSEED